MKIQVSEHSSFKPVSFTITCESGDELFALWHRFNVSCSHVEEKSCYKDTGIPNGAIEFYAVWSAIDGQVQKILK